MTDYARICDISVYQPDIDWPRLKELGIGIIARAGQNFWRDPIWDEHYAGARAAGVPIGIYWFWQPDQPSQQQIDGFLNVWKNLPWKPKVIALDVEGIEYLENGEWKLVTPPSIAFHSQHVWHWLTAIELETGITPLVYTAQGYWNAWTDPAYDWNHFPLWVANWLVYSPDAIRYPRDWSAWQIWQYEGGTGRQEGIAGPVDLDYFNGTTEQMYAYFGMDGGQTMTTIYKPNVPMAQRAWVMEVRGDQKVTAGFASLGVDALVLPMVNMPWDGSHQRVLVEPTFQGRVQEAGNISVFGKIVIDAGIVTTEQHSKDELEGHNIWQNLVVPKILDAWHIGPWTSATLKPADFYPVKALIFEQVAEMDHRSPSREIEDGWQAYFFRYVVDKLRVLINAGAVPNVPLILKTTPGWLQKYSADYAIMLQDGRASWLYLDLSESKLDSTGIFADLWSIFKFAPGDSFQFSYVPDHYADRVLLFEFTAGKQQMGFVTGNNLAYLSLWCDTAAGLAEFLEGSVIIPPPPVTPPPELEALKVRVEALELLVGELSAWARSVEVRPFQGPG